jgi:hypothetical protein
MQGAGVAAVDGLPVQRLGTHDVPGPFPQRGQKPQRA